MNFTSILSAFAVILSISSSSAWSVYEHDQNDLQLSKQTSLMSRHPYASLNQEPKKGVMTLCFKEQEKASLVFEVFLPATPNEISLRMIHYGQEDDCCGFGGEKKVMIDSSIDTLKKVYRAVEVSNINNSRSYIPATYTRYASWIISNDRLIQGLVQAEQDQSSNDSYNSIKYVSKIMKIAGLNNVDFGLWKKKANNLKLLVDSHIQPRPDYTNVNLPAY